MDGAAFLEIHTETAACQQRRAEQGTVTLRENRDDGFLTIPYDYRQVYVGAERDAAGGERIHLCHERQTESRDSVCRKYKRAAEAGVYNEFDG
jgi:hypothetical protein